jgi:predicted RND superfamily exporter protein
LKLLVNGLSAAVRKYPWFVVIATVIVGMVMGGLSGQFTPEEDSNDSFAPDAPELAAVERISELFGEDSTVGVMQVIISAPEGGDVFSADGLSTVQAVSEQVRSGKLSEYLIPEDRQPAIVSFLAPVEQAVAQGQPIPASDAELRQLYLSALQQIPEEQAGFTAQLISGSGDATTPTADKGLMLIFNTAGAALEIEDFVDLSADTADEISAVALPAGYTAEAFSFELLFADQDEFQAEIGRLFATAGLIILVVLSIVFLIVPRRTRNRILVTAGVLGIAASVFVAILPTLATILDSVFPDALKDWPSGNLLLIAVAVVLLTFTLWAVSSNRLRRTVADTLITLVAIFFAIGIMNGVGYLIFTEASPMAQILPILLIGLGVDYSIHVTTRYRDEISEGASVDRAIARSVRTVGVALVLATVTTAVGFLTNLTNEIPALREFGLLAAVGIVVSFVLMLTFVPAVRELLDRRAERNGRLDREALIGGEARALPRLIGSTSGLATKFAAGTIVISLVLGGLGAWGVTQLETKFSFLDFIPTTSPLRQTFETLLNDFGGGFGENTQILVEGDVATPEAWNAMVAGNSNLVDTPGVVTFAGQPQGTSPVASIGALGSPESPLFAPAVGAALAGAGIGADFIAPAGADVAAVYDAAFTAAPDQMASVLHRAGSGSYSAALFDITTQAGESGANALRADAAEDFAPITEQGLSAVATSDEIINDVVVTTLRDSQVSSLLLTLLAALILLVINFWVEARRPMLGVITTLPVVLVVALSFALMVVFGIPFGPVTATIAALAIGIGIPYMIHITHRYLEERARHRDAAAAIKSTLTHTGGALAGSAVTTIAGFGILVTSTTIPFRQFGFVTAYTILLAMLAAVLVLPSLLYVWDGFHRKRGEKPFEEEILYAAIDEPEGLPEEWQGTASIEEAAPEPERTH